MVGVVSSSSCSATSPHHQAMPASLDATVPANRCINVRQFRARALRRSGELELLQRERQGRFGWCL